MSELLPIAPLLLVAAGGLAVMMLDAFARERAELALVTAMTLGVTAAVSMSGLAQGMDVSEAPEFVTRYLAVDSFGLFCDVAICLGGALAALLAGGYLREHGLERGEFYVLILFSALGGMVLARATDMLTLFIGLETMSLGVYAMAAFRRTSARAVEGAMKYFLLGSFAAALLLFGSALLYGATGHTDFTGIAATIEAGENHTILTILGLMLVTVGLTFKVSAVPFHMWTPDAYEGSVTPATAFMSVVVKAAAFAVMDEFLVVGVDISPEDGFVLALGVPHVRAGRTVEHAHAGEGVDGLRADAVNHVEVALADVEFEAVGLRVGMHHVGDPPEAAGVVRVGSAHEGEALGPAVEIAHVAEFGLGEGFGQVALHEREGGAGHLEHLAGLVAAAHGVHGAGEQDRQPAHERDEDRHRHEQFGQGETTAVRPHRPGAGHVIPG